MSQPTLHALVPNWKLLRLVWPFLVIVAILVALAIQVTDILSAARSFVEGESRWSKAQKDAIFHLINYAQTRSPAHYREYLRTIYIPQRLGDARVELEKPHPNYALARKSLLEGGVHEGDVDGVIRLYTRFRDIPYIDRVVKVWTKGDRHIEQLHEAAEELRRVIEQDSSADAQILQTIRPIYEINSHLIPLAVEFSETFGEASRASKLILLFVTLTVPAVLIPLGVRFSGHMLRQSEASETALKISEERFQVAVSGSNDGLWDWNVATREWYFSPRLFQLLGYERDEILGTWPVFMSHLHPDDYGLVQSTLDAHLKSGVAYDAEIRLHTKTGDYRWFRMRGQSVFNGEGVPVRMAGAITDITDMKRAAADLFAEKERAQVTLASIADGVITTDTEGRIEYMNPVAEKLTGWTTQKARGLPHQTLCRLVDEATRRPIPCPVAQVLSKEWTNDGADNTLLLRDDGTEVPVVKLAAPIRDRSGEITGVVVALHDVSRERQYAAKLSYQASHDSLTGLINRSEFERRLELAIQSAAQAGRRHAVMYLDLDQFKVVNDTCGHAAGDHLMRQVSTLLQQCLREGDTLARLGGDEFGVLLENCPLDAAERIAEKLRQTVADLYFSWSRLSFKIGVSIGLVILDDGLLSLPEVLRAADTACYMAKEKGRNRVQLYHPEDSELTIRQGEMEWVGRLQRALDENRFVLYAQEIRPVRPGLDDGMHCELLLRMLDEAGELVPPMAFIPAAERYNLMPAIDRWVIRTALATLARIRADASREQVQLCSINLSGASIGDERFLDFVREQVARFEVPHDSLCFEITETAAIANLGKATHFIREMKELGCRFSLDDVGAGMSSFAYLKHLPVDFLKIDGGFVKDMAEDPIDRALVEAINNVGHVMGKQTIAEFVHNRQVLAALREIGVDYAQGYGVARPRPFEPRLLVASRVA